MRGVSMRVAAVAGQVVPVRPSQIRRLGAMAVVDPANERQRRPPRGRAPVRRAVTAWRGLDRQACRAPGCHLPTAVVEDGHHALHAEAAGWDGGSHEHDGDDGGDQPFQSPPAAASPAHSRVASSATRATPPQPDLGPRGVTTTYMGWGHLRRLAVATAAGRAAARDPHAQHGTAAAATQSRSAWPPHELRRDSQPNPVVHPQSPFLAPILSPHISSPLAIVTNQRLSLSAGPLQDDRTDALHSVPSPVCAASM
ncbi:hypothetical protein ACP4OV_004399 [Aristida adscensionis]